MDSPYQIIPERMFSARVPPDRRPNRLSAALAAARRSRDLIDLTVSNPTCVGLEYPPDLLEALASAEGLAYRPEPFGIADARRAIADTFVRRGIRMSPDRVILTASTSEAYSLLFKLLCDPGTSVLTPIPSYPLFDHLVRLDAVEQRRYRLEYHGTWEVDLASLDAAWNDGTRAVLAVSPNNPTGSVLTASGAAELTTRCASRAAALIVDEVFADYPLGAPWTDPAALGQDRCLLFRLGGLSKSAGLPQLKLGWMAVSGPDLLVSEALDRLELICDTYLSVSTPVQLAARDLLARSVVVRDRILERLRTNLATARAVAADAGGAVSILDPDGGWSVALRVPFTSGEEALALDLLAQGVIVHPGFFFDFPHEAFLVVSLLPEPDAFARGLRIVMERAHA